MWCCWFSSLVLGHFDWKIYTCLLWGRCHLCCGRLVHIFLSYLMHYYLQICRSSQTFWANDFYSKTFLCFSFGSVNTEHAGTDVFLAGRVSGVEWIAFVTFTMHIPKGEQVWSFCGSLDFKEFAWGRNFHSCTDLWDFKSFLTDL